MHLGLEFGRHGAPHCQIQNNVVVFNADDYTWTAYDLTLADGQGPNIKACMAYSVTDGPGRPGNDAAPDLLEPTPDGQYLAVAFRGPAPVSVTHSAQGSYPGVGIVELLDGGASGRLATVLRTTNTVDTSMGAAPNGHTYVGAERGDVHGGDCGRRRATHYALHPHAGVARGRRRRR